MFKNLFQKKLDPVNEFFNGFSKEKKIALLLVFKFLAQIDSNKSYNEKELIFLTYFKKTLKLNDYEVRDELLVDIEGQLNKLETIGTFYKVSVLMLLRLLANIDLPAIAIELVIINDLCERWDLDVDEHFGQLVESEQEKIVNLFQNIVMPNFDKDCAEGAAVVNKLLTGGHKLSAETGSLIYNNIQIMLMMHETHSIDRLSIEIQDLENIKITEENCELLFRFLRGRILVKMKEK